MTDKLVLFTFVVLLATGFYFGRSPISVGAGYSAKVMCSEVFTSGWTPAFAEQQETKSMLVPIYSTTFDKDSVTVSTLFGFITRTAYVNKNGGCTLLPEGKTERHYFDLPQQTSTEEDQSKNWPEGGKDAVTNEDKNVNYNELNTLLDAAFHEPVVDAVGIYRRTRAIVIVHDGKIIAERYAPAFSPTTRFPGWSVTKSLFSSLIGQRISEGKLSLQQNNLFKEWENDARRNITIGDLLNASSGLAFKEGNGPAEDTANLLFNSESVVASALSHKATSDKKWAYSSADANLLGAALRKSFGGDDKLYWSYPQKFFNKININSAVLDTDYQGNFVPSSYSHLTARDWARYGLFALQKGKWIDSQVLPTSWFDYAFTPAATAPNGEYGAQWWLNRGSEDNNRRFPTLPADAVFASGFEDQSIAIFPSHKLVVVRLGGTSPSYAWNVENFLGYLLENVIRN